MRKPVSLLFATLAASLAAFAANAAPIDFVAEAAGNERGVTSGTSFSSVNFGGLTLQFDSDNPDYFPYFDDLANGLPAGLGLCKALSSGPGSICADTSDDDITMGEGVTVSFLDGPFDVRALSFNDTAHNNLNANDVAQLIISINGGADLLFTFAGAIAAAQSGAFLGVDKIRFAYADTRFYIESISDAPIPAALPLLLSGLAGLFLASRRRPR